MCVQVSREHVTVTASDATCAVVKALKRSFMTRAATPPGAGAEILRPLDVSQVQTALPFRLRKPASPLIGCQSSGLDDLSLMAQRSMLRCAFELGHHLSHACQYT